MINLVGNLNADLILAQVKERPDFGEEHLVDNMILRPGGIANLIFPLAKLGVKPRVIATVGMDDYGQKIYDEMLPLMEDGITRTKTPTAVSVAIVKDDGARYFVTYRGNFDEFTKETIVKVPHFEDAKATLFYGYFLLPKMGVDGAKECLVRAQKAGQLTFFDANSAIDGWSEKSRQDIMALLPYVDYFMPNDDELFYLTGIQDMEEAVEYLLLHGAKNIVIKRGKEGASFYSKAQSIHQKGYPVKAFDTTGAGDSFNAGFIYSIVQQRDIQQSLLFGNALASFVVSRKEDRYPTLEEIENRVCILNKP